VKCRWCAKSNRRPSQYEQQVLGGEEYARLCVRCANWRLKNPYSALLPMRRIAA
jgi:hypothetical protein